MKCFFKGVLQMCISPKIQLASAPRMLKLVGVAAALTVGSTAESTVVPKVSVVGFVSLVYIVT